MGQKVNPHGLRVGVIKGWDATWYANKRNFSTYLIQDYKIREFVKKKYYTFGISRITIERSQGKCTINILTSKPGMIIGQKGAGIEQLKKELLPFSKGDVINVSILELKQPDKDATLVAESVAMQLEKRSSFRRTMKQAMGRVMRAGAKGVKIMVSGRLDGAEIARSEHYHEGSIPLQTLRADIDYGVANALTTFGIIGVKVWVYKGEVLGKANANLEIAQRGGRSPRGDGRAHEDLGANSTSRGSRPATGGVQSRGDKPGFRPKTDNASRTGDKSADRAGDKPSDKTPRGDRSKAQGDRAHGKTTATKPSAPVVPRVQKVAKPKVENVEKPANETPETPAAEQVSKE